VAADAASSCDLLPASRQYRAFRQIRSVEQELLWRAGIMKHPRRKLATVLALGVGAVLTAPLAGCVDEKPAPEKGVVDSSLPPGDPTEPSALGKADAGDELAALSVESPHPYANDMNETYEIDLSFLPSCAYRVQLHFSVFRLEQGYDFVRIDSPADENSQSLTGTRDGTWSDWFYIDQSDKKLVVTLDTDYSITRHGFEIDQVKYQGAPICPAVVIPPCQSGEVDTNPAPGVCDCPQFPTCVATADIEIQRQVFRGFDNKGKLVRGHDAFTTAPGPADGLVETNIGTVGEDRLLAVVRAAAVAGLLDAPGYDESGEWTDYFRIKAGDKEVVFRAPLGEHTPEVQAVIDQFLNLFDCSQSVDPMVCGSDYVCNPDGDCEEDQGCFCTEQYDPVCGAGGRTFGNACKASCAGVAITHPGECGIEGDFCGGLLGLICLPDFKCWYQPGGANIPFPDAGGTCRPLDYCDAPPDCDGLVHPATVGQWACNDNQCEWQEGAFFQQVIGWSFETAHPYQNDASSWKQLYLPEGSIEVRLDTIGDFELENGYDFLELWTYDGGWQKVATFTGAEGPTPNQVFAGQYHYLHFVSDYSVTGAGFNLVAEYR
jgi:hypothetical protein